MLRYRRGIRCLHLTRSIRKPESFTVFDRNRKRLQRNHSAQEKDLLSYEHLKREIALRLSDRLFDIKENFEVAVDLGCGRCLLAPHILTEKVGHIVQIDVSDGLLGRVEKSSGVVTSTSKVIADEELIPLGPSTVDLVVSSLSLQWINNLPGLFDRIFDVLRENGAFIAALFGGNSVYQLRCALQLAELERLGGIGMHISPFTEVSSLGTLLNQSGFRLLTVDVDSIDIVYPNIFAIMEDLQGMAENNALIAGANHIHRDVLIAANSIYKEFYGESDGGLPITFQIFYLIGWKPGPNMPTAAQRGSATMSLKDMEKLFSSQAPKS